MTGEVFIGRAFPRAFVVPKGATFIDCTFIGGIIGAYGTTFIRCTSLIEPAHQPRFSVPLLPRPLSWWARMILGIPQG